MRRNRGAMRILAAGIPLTALLFLVVFWGLLFPSSGEFSGTLNGGGASFLNPQIQVWASRYYGLSGGRVRVNYQSIGSGAGQAKFREGLLDFAGSDPPLKPEIYQELIEGPGVLQFPVIVGSVAVVYNLPGVPEGGLRLTGEVLAKIYLGEIVFWDDPEIAEINPGLQLPHERIVAVHRSDGSGTTLIFAAYLSSVSEEWRERVGWDFTVQWPVDELGNGVGGKGNEGVAAAVQQNLYSIGYVELSYAVGGDFKVAKLMNREGKYVLPTAETVKSAVAMVSRNLPEAYEDWSGIVKLLVNPGGEDSYPIASFSFIILRGEYEPVKAALIKEFFRWVLTEGQKPENLVEGYVPLPPEVAGKGLRALELLRVEGK